MHVGTCPCFLPTPFVVDATPRPSLDAVRDNRRRSPCGSRKTRATFGRHRRADTRRNPRLLPRDPDRRIHLRAAGRQRRQAGVAVARRRQDHDRHARQGPRLSDRAPHRLAVGPGQAAADRASRPTAAPLPRPSRRRASDSSTTARNTCCSSRPAARRPRSATGFRSNSAICSRRRRRCGFSMPASATAPCCRG